MQTVRYVVVRCVVVTRLTNPAVAGMTIVAAEALARKLLNRNTEFTADERAAFDALYNSYDAKAPYSSAGYPGLQNDISKTAGDIYNGATGGQLPAMWTHSNQNQYPDSNGNGLRDDYWYREFFGVDYRPGGHEAELFVGYFADRMTDSVQRATNCAAGNLDVLTPLGRTKEMFPATTPLLEAIIVEAGRA